MTGISTIAILTQICLHIKMSTKIRKSYIRPDDRQNQQNEIPLQPLIPPGYGLSPLLQAPNVHPNLQPPGGLDLNNNQVPQPGQIAGAGPGIGVDNNQPADPED